MTTRTFLRAGAILACLVAPSLAAAQTSAGARRVGIIYPSGRQMVVDGLRQGLRELGLEEGKQLVLDVHEVEGDLKTVAKTAGDLERQRVALLYTITTGVTTGARQATTQVPIVFNMGSDPVAAKLVESLARPGGRLTGIHSLSRDATPKRLELLKRIVPGLARVVTFYNADDTSAAGIRVTREAARKLGVELVERRAASVEELRHRLQGLAARDAHAYFHTPGELATSQSQLIIDAARARRWATMFNETSIVDRGALAAYGQDSHEVGRLSAKYVQRILGGAPPKDVPVEKYDKVGLALNLRTAREIGLTILPAVRALADTVVE